MKWKSVLTYIFAATMVSHTVYAQPPDGAPRPPQDVNIINQPIDVNVVSQPTVTIDNDLANPVPVTGVYARTPFHATQVITVASGQPGSPTPGQVFVTVPSGQRAVIETIAFRASVPTNQVPSVQLRTTVNGVLANYYAAVPVMSNPAGKFSTTQFLRAYADPLTDILARGIRDNFVTGTASFDVTISGYFVPEDSPELAP